MKRNEAVFCSSVQFIVVLAWLLFVSGSLSANTVAHEYFLDNGLKLIVKEDHRSPVAIQQIWYKVGSIDEVNGKTGVAHALEHMMFKGTAKVPAGEFSRRIAAAGGVENAFTGGDYTAYYQQLHKRHLPMAMELESDRMRNLLLTEDEFSKEIQVVMEERRLRTDDQPRSLLFEKMMATAFQAHPYRRPVIGWMNDLEQMRVNDHQEWYDKWYAPNNAVLVIVGDVNPAEVFKLTNKYYGKIQKSPVPSLAERNPQTEPAQVGIKHLRVKAPAELPYLLMGYKVPTIRDPKSDWEPYALEVLAGILDGNASARLNKTLVREKQMAVSVGAGYDAIARGRQGMFYLDATPSRDKTIEELEKAIRLEIDKIIQSGITEQELSRVKAQVIAGHVYQLDSISAQAMQIGQLESVGLSYQDEAIILEKLKAVDVEQVREVAKKYLTDDVLTIAVLDPQPLNKSSPPKKMINSRH